MRKILIVDDMAIVRDPIAAMLRGAGFEAVSAATGRDAIQLLRSEHPDVVLLDIHLPEMSGFEVLRAMRGDPQTAKVPVLLLSSEESRECVRKAAQMGVQGYLLKSQFTVADLLARIHKYTDDADKPVPDLPGDKSTPSSIASKRAANSNTTELPQLLTRGECTRRVEKALEVKTLSGVVAQVISLAASPHGDASGLAKLIARDAALSARVLQVANSAAYASKRGVTTVADAVRHVGCSTVRNIAATVGIFDAMPPATADGFGLIRCWQHSLAVAQLCELLAGTNKEAAGSAYLVGLCHDLGEIIIRTQFAAEYAEVIAAQQQTDKRRDEVERIMLGVTHNDLVATILRCLKLPDAVRKPIENFYGVSSRSGGQLTDPLARILHLANEYAKGLLLASSPTSRVGTFPRAVCRQATGRDEPAAPPALEFTNAITAMTLMLARLSPAEQEELNRPLIPRDDAKIWLARDRAFSSFCPVTAALSAITQVDLHDHLPAAKEMTDHRALIILCEDATKKGWTADEIAAARAGANDAMLPTLRLVPASANESATDCLAIPAPLDQLSHAVAVTIGGNAVQQ